MRIRVMYGTLHNNIIRQIFNINKIHNIPNTVLYTLYSYVGHNISASVCRLGCIGL